MEDIIIMISTSLDNWYQWHYNHNTRRSSTDEKFETSFNALSSKIGTFKDALLFNAKSTADYYEGERLGVLFSGGSESELLIRLYKEIGKDVVAYIFRYEDDINLYDVSYAVTIAESLSVPYKVIDFNLKKFYLNDAEQISELAQVDRPRALPQLKFLDYFDEVAIAGASDPTWYRPSDDYSKKVEWLMCDFEHDVGWSKYVKEISRPAIMEWFKWTPEMVVGFTKSKWFHNLTNDHYYGKLGINSTKLIGYREAYPSMIDRIKKTGFETVDPLIAEFEQHLATKYNGLPYRGTVTRTIDQILQLESQ
jgi:hypothetical protein